MKTKLAGAWLHAFHRSQEMGFTLLELTIVLVVSGILAAIALPSFLNQANRAKQVEAESYLGSLNRAQQAHYLEHARFAENIPELGISTPQNSPNYQFKIVPQNSNNSAPYVVHYAESRSTHLKPYVGIAALLQTSAGEPIIQTLLCESEQSSQGKAPDPTVNANSLACALGTRNVSR